LLDAYADPRKFGKQVGGDIIANKKTFLLIKALEKVKGKQKNELNKWLTSTRFNKEKKVTAVKKLYDSLNVSSYAERKINQYFTKGFRSLEKLAPTYDTGILNEFTRSMINRQK
jgi:geranylgeranyl diphosphate synthase, type II